MVGLHGKESSSGAVRPGCFHRRLQLDPQQPHQYGVGVYEVVYVLLIAWERPLLRFCHLSVDRKLIRVDRGAASQQEGATITLFTLSHCPCAVQFSLWCMSVGVQGVTCKLNFESSNGPPSSPKLNSA
jgi:hypothetical protein